MAIFTIRKSIMYAFASHHCACVVKWLSVASLLLVMAGSSGWCQTQPPGMEYLETVDVGGGLYEWRYRFVPEQQLPANEFFELTGLYDVQASGFTSAQNWIITHTATTFRMTWGGPGVRPANCQECPTAGTYFYYRSSSPTAGEVPWYRSDVAAENGTTFGSAEPTEIPASVTVYDNYLSFGAFAPTAGTSDTASSVIASESAASAWGPTSVIPAVGNYDVAYVQIESPRRLNLSLQMNGHLKRCSSTGQAFAGVDGRKQTPGPYELATQWKVAFKGRFLTPAGVQYASPTSSQLTDYDTWTDWSPSGNDPTSDEGWLWPSATDAWTGEAVAGYTSLGSLDLLVERNQYTESSMAGPAGICVIERVLRRGQQDVAGNYKQVIELQLTYAE